MIVLKYKLKNGKLFVTCSYAAVLLNDAGNSVGGINVVSGTVLKLVLIIQINGNIIRTLPSIKTRYTNMLPFFIFGLFTCFSILLCHLSRLYIICNPFLLSDKLYCRNDCNQNDTPYNQC